MSENVNETVKKPRWSTGRMFSNLPFFYFLSFLALLYIANAHYSDTKVRKIQKLKKELEELRWEYHSMKSDFLIQSSESQITKEVTSLKWSAQHKTPKTIEVK